ncbi:MAG TPA: hypothetical protein VGH44_03215 [Candidatus Saccharimonadia bacterium]
MSGLGLFPIAQAAPDCSAIRVGRCLNIGYFTGLDGTAPPLNGVVGHDTLLPSIFTYSDPAGVPASTWAFPGPSDPTYGTGSSLSNSVNAQHFIAFIKSDLYAPSPGGPGCVLSQPNPPADISQNSGLDPDTGCPAWRRKVSGAAFLVLTMIGSPYTDYPGSAGPPPTGPQYVFGDNLITGVNDAKAEFDTWATLVLAASAAGDVNWDVTMALPAGIVDSYGADYGHDVVAYRTPFSDLAQMIVFSSSTGNYMINRYCSNVEGTLDSLPKILGYNMKLTASGTVSTVLPGQTGAIDISVQNLGPNPSTSGALQVQLPGSNVAKPCASACSDPQQSPLTSYEITRGFTSTGSEVPGVSGPNWYWNTQSIPVGRLTTTSLTFTVPATAAPDSLITFDIYYYPADQSGGVAHTTVTFRVAAISYPSVVGLNSDVHAGGGLCGGTMSSGQVIGNARGGSYSQYVLSTDGSISNFGSGGNNSLNMGNAGAYSQVCRPDLYTAAQNYLAAGAPDATKLGSGTYNISSWKGVYYISGNANICGTVSNLITIVQESGTLYVGGNGCATNSIVITSASAQPKAAPSLGIIAGPTSEIAIEAAVTRVDAYLFADSTIDTCDTTWGGTCRSTLQVNGFLMAYDIGYKRLGSGLGSQVAEEITLNPQIYFNPPKFFDAQSNDSSQLQGLGEQPPLF